MEKLICAEYKNGSFRGGINTIKLITYKDKISITQLLQRYVVKMYHTYILHLGLDRTEAMICNICTDRTLEETSLKKSRNVTYANVQNGE